ncbi:hypothetical protein [Dickeya oryzae]
MSLIAMAAIAFGFTFIIIGKFSAEGGSFQTYTKDGKSYSLLKVYGDNVFLREIKEEKSSGDIIYFNTKDMTGMMLKVDN